MELPQWAMEIESRAESIKNAEWFDDMESLKCLSICVNDIPKLLAALRIAVEGLNSACYIDLAEEALQKIEGMNDPKKQSN